MRKGTVYLFLALIIAFAGSAWARTPDGQTPAEETVCDGLSGPLFGLCNAYCEAMDCDTGANASDRACERILANFQRKSGGEDPPCIASADCCEQPGTGAPGCGDAECQTLVCDFDPFCCEAEWDFICVDEASAVCPVCGAGEEPPVPGV